MKAQHLLILLFGPFLMASCYHGFAYFDLDRFNIGKDHGLGTRTISGTFLLKIVRCDTYLGNEAVVKHVPSPKSVEAVQYSYFVFTKEGRVYYNSKNSETPYTMISIEIPDTVKVCRAEDELALQGFYIVESIMDEETQRRYERIHMEFERKKGSPKKKKHYYIDAELMQGDSSIHILEFERPRRNTPIRGGLGTGRGSNYKRFHADSVFYFPLEFHRTNERVLLDYTACPNRG